MPEAGRPRSTSLLLPQQAAVDAPRPARAIVVSIDLFKRGVASHIFVRGDRGLEFQEVVRVIDIARGAGWDHVGLMTQ
jgi:hypothetical protein